MLPWIMPFGIYMAFIALEPATSWVSELFVARSSGPDLWHLWLYPLKITAVLVALWLFWPRYKELQKPSTMGMTQVLVALGAGTLVYLAWVRMAWPWAIQGQMTAYNPFDVGPSVGIALAIVRLVGATVVVPPMEELFWRSFLLRWLITTPFTAVRLGTFTPVSCAVTVILFGFEHHLWLAGIMSGLIYTILLYQSRDLWSCILAHAVTNGLLGCHVLLTREWHWW